MGTKERSRGRRWLLLSALLFALGTCIAQAAPPPRASEVLQLDPRDGARSLLDVQGAFVAAHPRNAELATSGQLPFRPLDLRRALPFDEGGELWIRLRLQPAAAGAPGWHLEVPFPPVDAVSSFEQVGGRWIERTAGDTQAMPLWPLPGRYPAFELQLPAGTATDVYLRVRHSTPAAIPVRLVGSAGHQQQMLLEYLALGLLLGAMGLLGVGGAGIALWLRDAMYGWYALYALLTLLALASYTGVAAHLLWGRLPAWSDAAPGTLTLATGTVAMVMGMRLSPVVAGTIGLRRMLWLAVVAGLALTVAFALAQRALGMLMLGGYLLAVTALSLVVANVIRRRGDRVGTWLLVATIPLCAAALAAAARAFGLLPASWLTEYALVFALALNLPALLVALNNRSGERRGAELRRLASDSQDALTGLLKAEPFGAKLRQAVFRFRQRGEDAAVAMIEVRNYAAIKEQFGAEAAEEALLHAVIKLRRLVRDVDVAGRLGENRFGLILEGVSMRQPVNSLGPRLITAGLIRDPGQPAAVQFHVAATLISEQGVAASELLVALEGLLAEMSPRTKRPFRYLPGADGADREPAASEPNAAPAPFSAS